MEDSCRYLYRGISEEMHQKNTGLVPRGTSFYRCITIGQDFTVGSGITVGGSVNNAVVGHQRNSEIFPSSGVSMTPFFKRAEYYALGGDKRPKGLVYKIDCNLLGENSVKKYRVRDYAEFPEIPEDDEVILVAADNGALPSKIVIEVIEMTSNS